ncbi:phage integrase SAM-like domain and Arm DNA-binding domain-containing protein [Flavihumibacter cheonanensis]|uniref:phage integrase SAM-like domain and Arm DNA-binding domain-containing protein n=1 Tax=Flavihumibacter cheonanensis TaxID=1442385 RepID=UPI001EF9259C|nr:phage integrase SAM-like domain and Arm DNA-binding domain-containing protein [Flavihumibacter cheonanensis]MCG7752239.1 phage integrase SAM-like domain and Arm DNA-binding domain-containing protein [Flavihumibacter cheonanensis]
MERSFGLFFFLRKHTDSAGVGNIYCRITVDGKSVELSLKRTCNIENLNSQSSRLNGRSDSVKSLNAFLDAMQHKIYEAKRSLLEQGIILTPEAIKACVLGEDYEKSTKKILEIIQQHNDQMKVLVGKQYFPGTLQRYEISLRHTQSFIKWRYKRTDLELHHLNYEFLTEYDFWLKFVQNCGHNSTVKYLSNFRKKINR